MQNATETERLFLNKLTTEDDAFITSLVNSKGWIRFVGDRNVHSKAEVAVYIGKILNTPDLYYWVVSMKEGNIP